MRFIVGCILLCWGVAAPCSGCAQESGGLFVQDSLRPTEWHVRYDTTHLARALFPLPPARPVVGNVRLQPLISGSSILRVEVKGLPTRVYVLNNISLQIGGYVTLSNGQAWLWSPYPNGFLDARTLSFPLP